MSYDLLAQLAYFIGTPSGSFCGGESAQAVKRQSLSTTVLSRTALMYKTTQNQFCEKKLTDGVD